MRVRIIQILVLMYKLIHLPVKRQRVIIILVHILELYSDIRIFSEYLNPFWKSVFHERFVCIQIVSYECISALLTRAESGHPHSVGE